MNTITEWMVSEGIAENGFAAGHIVVGLQLYNYPREQQETMCRLYRRWRPRTETRQSKRDQLPAKQAYDLVIAGINPDDVVMRQIELDPAMLQVIEQADEVEGESVG